MTDSRKQELEDFGTLLNDVVQRAWTIVTNRPLEEIEKVDGYTRRWAEQWAAYQSSNAKKEGEIAPMVPAMVGYAIESLATKLFLPKVWANYRVVLQDIHGNTRPDVVLYDSNGRDVAWFDLTSRGSVGHIEAKVGAGWRTRPLVLEISYPQTDAAYIGKQMKAYTDAGSPTLATYGPQQVENYWIEKARFDITMMKVQPTVSACLDPLKKNYYSMTNLRKAVKEALSTLASEPLTDKQAASVVQYLYGNHKSWGFVGATDKYGMVPSKFSSLSTAPAEGILQKISAATGVTVSDDEIRDRLHVIRPEMLTNLQAQHRYL